MNVDLVVGKVANRVAHTVVDMKVNKVADMEVFNVHTYIQKAKNFFSPNKFAKKVRKSQRQKCVNHQNCENFVSKGHFREKYKMYLYIYTIFKQ